MPVPLTPDPHLLGRLDGLVLQAKGVVEGLLAGLHRSPFLGYSSEFAAYRQYLQGDNLRYLDWKVWGRTDKLYIKQFEDDTNLNCHILLDASASMDFGRQNKFEYGRLLALALAYLMSRQHDGVGLTLLGGRTPTVLPARGGTPHLENVFVTLGQAVPAGGGSAGPVGPFYRRGLAVIISDLLATETEMFEVFRQLHSQRQELLVFHVLAPEELDFDYEGEYLFEDAESGATLPVHAGMFRKDYRNRVRAFQQRVMTECEKYEADYCGLRTDQPLAEALTAYLERRMAR